MRIILMFLFYALIFKSSAQSHEEKINRYALVTRHNVINNSIDTFASLTVGNGRFAFTVDATGLQSFPVYYEHGVLLGTQSQWGWGGFTNSEHYKFGETLKAYHVNGRDISYPVQFNSPKRQRDAANWFRENRHRLQLGNIGFIILKKDGTEVAPNDIKNIRQELDLWTGRIKSHFTVDGEVVDVLTYGDAHLDGIGAQIVSPLIKERRLAVRIHFPYAGGFSDRGTNYNDTDKHTSYILFNDARRSVLEHQIDSAAYKVDLSWSAQAKLAKSKQHEFILIPSDNSERFSFSAVFINESNDKNIFTDFAEVKNSSIKGWEKFWKSGAAVDFSGSTDLRASELERRVVLSQYLTRVQCAGDYPPQETGLTYNSWFGKAHLEMHWWHGVHFALWGRPELLQPSMNWYDKIKDKGIAIAKRQGFDGIRWPKMVDDKGNESPSTVAPFLIWQQPHFIYMTELLYKTMPDKSAILNKYKELVFATADFMSSFAYFDKVKKHYVLGPGIISSPEISVPEQTLNPSYELAYWYWGLSIAKKWKERLKQPRDKKWDDIMSQLSPLPQKDGVYLENEDEPDNYSNPKYLTSHPSVLAVYGILPYSKMTDTAVMKRTYDLILKKWDWDGTWGWDFPMMAMTAARLNMPEQAVDALLMNVTKNSYLPDGHNYQDKDLTIYLPGNGGLLTAVAMMCAGWDGSSSNNPGFPKNAKWKVKWEGLKKMP